MAVKEHAIATLALEPSVDVQELMLRFYEAVSRGDFESVDRLVSRQSGIHWIGTDPTEWWDDFDAVARAWRDQAAAAGGPTRISAGQLATYRHGDVAWVSDRPEFHIAGRALPFRFTAVWLHEPEGWRIVQAHASFGVANESVLRTK